MDYYDSNGLPVTKDGDGGDSCADAGTIWTLSDLPPNIPMAVYNQDGQEPLRHPDATKWYGRPKHFSRDQMIPYLCFLIIWHNTTEHLRENLFAQHMKKWLVVAWNTLSDDETTTKFPDPTLTEIWGLWIRANRAWWLYPLLLICDLETLGGAISWYFRSDNVTRNHLLVMWTTNQVYPTPWSWITWWITPKVMMVDRWETHCGLTGEIPTADLFRKKIFG